MEVLAALVGVLLGYMILAAISFGSVLALIMSWGRNHSVLWAVVHGWLSWFYVIYYCMQRKSAIS